MDSVLYNTSRENPLVPASAIFPSKMSWVGGCGVWGVGLGREQKVSGQSSQTWWWSCVHKVTQRSLKTKYFSCNCDISASEGDNLHRKKNGEAFWWTIFESVVVAVAECLEVFEVFAHFWVLCKVSLADSSPGSQAISRARLISARGIVASSLGVQGSFGVFRGEGGSLLSGSIGSFSVDCLLIVV